MSTNENEHEIYEQNRRRLQEGLATIVHQAMRDHLQPADVYGDLEAVKMAVQYVVYRKADKEEKE